MSLGTSNNSPARCKLSPSLFGIIVILITHSWSWAETPLYASVTPQVSYGSVLSLAFGEPSSVEHYGNNNLQFGQLWLPTDMAEPIPLVIFIHGGCWLSDYDIVHTQALSTALSTQGYAVWSLEYRRVGNQGGGWPGTFEDISNAVDHVRELAERYPLDLNRVALVGHSAGGHLALWAASRKGFTEVNPLYTEDPLSVKVVISLAGIPDVVEYSRGSSSCNLAVEQLFGGSHAQYPERFSAGTPLDIVSLGVQLVMLQGKSDNIVPLTQAHSYIESLQESNPALQLQLIDEAGHFDLIHPGSPAWQQVLAAVKRELSVE